MKKLIVVELEEHETIKMVTVEKDDGITWFGIHDAPFKEITLLSEEEISSLCKTTYPKHDISGIDYEMDLQRMAFKNGIMEIINKILNQ